MRSDLRRLVPSALLLIVLIPGARGVRAGTVIERTVAFVNRKPVLLTDVALTKALLQLDEREGLEQTIDESLMYEEAYRLLNETPTEERIATAVSALQEKAGPAFPVAALRRKALVQLAISNYIEARLRPLVRVEEDEVRRIFNERAASDPQVPPFSMVADSIREALVRRGLDQKIEEWVASLRLRADVRRPRS